MRGSASATEASNKIADAHHVRFVSHLRLVYAEPIALQLRPTACPVGSASQRPSSLFLPSLSFRSTPPRLFDTVPQALSPVVLCRTCTSSRTRTCPSSPACACAKTWRVWLSSFAARDGRPPASRAACPAAAALWRHVAPASEFHVCMMPTPEQELGQPSQDRGPCIVALLDLDEEQSLSSPALPPARSPRERSCPRARAALSRGPSPIHLNETCSGLVDALQDSSPG